MYLTLAIATSMNRQFFDMTIFPLLGVFLIEILTWIDYFCRNGHRHEDCSLLGRWIDRWGTKSSVSGLQKRHWSPEGILENHIVYWTKRGEQGSRRQAQNDQSLPLAGTDKFFCFFSWLFGFVAPPRSEPTVIFIWEVLSYVNFTNFFGQKLVFWQFFCFFVVYLV